MKKNHRKNSVKKRHVSGKVGNRDVKEEARRGRRLSENISLRNLKGTGYNDDDEEIFYKRNFEVSDIWNWD